MPYSQLYPLITLIMHFDLIILVLQAFTLILFYLLFLPFYPFQTLLITTQQFLVITSNNFSFFIHKN